MKKPSSFFTDRQGVIAIMFAMMFPVIIATMGIGYDLAQAYLVRARLAQALDAAGLAAAGMTGTDEELQEKFTAFMHVNYPDNRLGTLKELQLTRAGNDIIVSGGVDVDTSFTQFFGIAVLTVTAKTQIRRELNGLEVALVLDNTGSMEGSKMTNLKAAAKNLVDILATAAENASEPDSVAMALVPYNMTVNVGSVYSTATWLDKAGDSTVAKSIFTGTASQNRFTKFTSMGLTWGGCVEVRAAPYDVTESPPTVTDVESLYVPYFAVDEPDSSDSTYGGPYYNNYRSDGVSSKKWAARQGNPSKYNGAPKKSGTNDVGYQYGPNAGCETQPLTRLTNSFTSFKTKIDAMNPIGDTNSMTGLMWGWHVLSPNAPFADGIAYNTPKHQKVMILMTDGQNNNALAPNNNESFYSGIGYIWQNRLGITSGSLSERRAKMDERMALLCENIKASGIILYTVRLETPSDSDYPMKGCATSPNYFYDVEDSSELTQVFESIANSIQSLRITQ